MGTHQLERRLGLGTIIAISISTMLGSGIFVLSLAFAKTGASVFLLYDGRSFYYSMHCQKRAGNRHAYVGGSYVYLERAFGPARVPSRALVYGSVCYSKVRLPSWVLVPTSMRFSPAALCS